MIELKNVSKIYHPSKNDESVGLKNINLTFKDKGLVFIVGKSGSGKSTLLNLLGLLDKPDTGSILIDGIDINRKKDKEKDTYRSGYIGLIFQEFNLLEEFNVYKNIKLSLDLKKTKISKSIIDKVLSLVNMENKGSRKINELSGGEKQRVGIARALIKNPSLILADEPTGNLDSNTSEEIFKLLKVISQDRLVIVVTHDVDSALNYADRIIELHDGEVLKDETYNNNFKNIENKTKIKKSKLSLKNSLSIAITNMKHKKIRLFITYLLVTFSLSLFAFTFSLTKYDVNLAHAKAMIKNKEYDVQIIKTNKGKETNSSYLLTTFNDKDLEKIDKLISVPYNKVLALSSNNQRLYITLGEEVENDTLYYEKNLSSEPNFIEYSNIDELNIIGNKPTNNNEILIHKILADYIIYYGVNIIELEDNKEVTKLYKPSSYEELINSNVHIKSADTYLIITGIIDDDMSKYDELKELKYIDIENNKDKLKLYKEFTIKSNEYLNNFIISSSFKDKTYLESNSMMNTTAFSTRILYNDKRYSLTSAVCLREGKPANVFTDKSEITIYDGVGTKEISYKDINPSEMVLSMGDLDNMLDGKITENIDNAIEEVNDENSVYYKKTYNEISAMVLNNMEEVKNIIGNEISIEITDSYNKLNEEETKVLKFKVIGLSTEVFSYFNQNDISKYIIKNVETLYLKTSIKDQDKLKDVLTKFPQEKSDYISKTIYSSIIKDVEKTIDKITPIMSYLSIIFLIFSVVLFSNYIFTSINTNKKKIGILRALGARKRDTFNIYVMESLLIGFISLISSSLLEVLFINYGNIYISHELFASMEPLVLDTKIILFLIIVVILEVFITSSLSITKLSSMKPIDAINNK